MVAARRLLLSTYRAARQSSPGRSLAVCSLNGRSRSFSSPISRNAPIFVISFIFKTSHCPKEQQSCQTVNYLFHIFIGLMLHRQFAFIRENECLFIVRMSIVILFQCIYQYLPDTLFDKLVIICIIKCILLRFIKRNV